jgi:hypothetical protein
MGDDKEDEMGIRLKEEKPVFIGENKRISIDELGRDYPELYSRAEKVERCGIIFDYLENRFDGRIFALMLGSKFGMNYISCYPILLREKGYSAPIQIYRNKNKNLIHIEAIEKLDKDLLEEMVTEFVLDVRLLPKDNIIYISTSDEERYYELHGYVLDSLLKEWKLKGKLKGREKCISFLHDPFSDDSLRRFR